MFGNAEHSLGTVANLEISIIATLFAMELCFDLMPDGDTV